MHKPLPELGGSLWTSRNQTRLSVVSGEMSVDTQQLSTDGQSTAGQDVNGADGLALI